MWVSRVENGAQLVDNRVSSSTALSGSGRKWWSGGQRTRFECWAAISLLTFRSAHTLQMYNTYINKIINNVNVQLAVSCKIKQSKRWICIAHHREHASDALLLPVSRLDVQPGTSTTLRDHGYWLVYHAILPSFRWVLIHRGEAQAE